MSAPTPPSRVSVNERKREVVRDELAQAAAKVLAFQGFEETTVECIAAAVGLSRRTFFRYFESKEDVVVHMLSAAGARLCTALRSRPADESAAAGLRQALSVFSQLSLDQPDKTLHMSRLILDTPALLARYLERQSQWQAEIAAILAHRSGLDLQTDPRPALAAGVALTAFHTALRRWVDSGGRAEMDQLVDEAFAFVAPALDLDGGARGVG